MGRNSKRDHLLDRISQCHIARVPPLLRQSTIKFPYYDTFTTVTRIRSEIDSCVQLSIAFTARIPTLNIRHRLTIYAFATFCVSDRKIQSVCICARMLTVLLQFGILI